MASVNSIIAWFPFIFTTPDEPSPQVIFPRVVILWDPKSGSIFDPAIAAFEVTEALTTELLANLAAVTASSAILAVVTSLSPRAVTPISVTELSSFFVNNLPVSVLTAISPVTRSLAPGSLPLARFNLIVFAIVRPPDG